MQLFLLDGLVARFCTVNSAHQCDPVAQSALENVCTPSLSQLTQSSESEGVRTCTYRQHKHISLRGVVIEIKTRPDHGWFGKHI